MQDVKNICFIINPVAGGRRKRKLEEFLREKVSANNRNVKFLYTKYPSHAYEYAKNETESGTDLIVAVGGDGTINEVARAVSLSDKTLGIIPHGSGNGFARHFGIPLNYKKALKILLEKPPVKIDVASINDRDFFCTSGIGFDAETGYYFRNYDRRGFVSYFFSFLKVFRDYSSEKYKLSIDGKLIETEAFFVNVANISQFGYHFYIAPNASAIDGMLDIVILQKFPKWKAPLLIMRSYFGSIHKSRYVLHYKAREVRILEPGTKKIIHIDGESGFSGGEMVYTIRPNSLKVIIP